MLILHMTNVANSNMVYRDQTRQIIEKIGDLPLLVRKGSARLTLPADWSNAKLYADDLGGKRVAEVPLQRDPDGVSFIAQTHRDTGPCMVYELVRE